MDDLLLELQQPITISEGGRLKAITKQEALLITLAKQSLEGNTKAWDLVWAISKHYELDQEPDKYLRSFRERSAAELKRPLKRVGEGRSGWIAGLDQQAAGSTARRNGLDGMARWCRPQIAMASSLAMRGGVAALGAWSRPSASREPGLRSTASGCQGTPGRLHRCAVAEYGHTLRSPCLP